MDAPKCRTEEEIRERLKKREAQLAAAEKIQWGDDVADLLMAVYELHWVLGEE